MWSPTRAEETNVARKLMSEETNAARKQMSEETNVAGKRRTLADHRKPYQHKKSIPALQYNLRLYCQLPTRSVCLN